MSYCKLPASGQICKKQKQKLCKERKGSHIYIITQEGQAILFFFSSSLCSFGRTEDIDAIFISRKKPPFTVKDLTVI